MSEQLHFDLVDEPWIPVVHHDQVREVSLREALVDAHEYRGLDLAEPLEAVAILRQVLLPVLFDACDLPRNEREWGERWTEGAALDAKRINEYLDRHRDRFDLFDSVAPFAQVAGLQTAKGETKSVSLLVAPEPTGNNVPIFGARTEAMPRHLSPARAARVLLATQCFDTAAIKSGAVGDPAVKGGKTTGNPTGPLGNLGLCIPVASSLAQTLRLNTPIVPQGLRTEDRPQWRQPPHTPEWTTRGALGLLDLLTFQSRRIRLVPDSLGSVRREEPTAASEPPLVTVSRVVLCAGDRLSPIPEYEPHTQWKQSDKPAADGPARVPVRFQPGRAGWRGLASLLATTRSGQGVQTTSLLTQAASLPRAGYLPVDFPLEVQTAGVVYGNQSAVVDDVISDVVPLPVSALLEDSEVRGLVLELVDQSERLRKAANDLDDTLRRAAGGGALPWDKSQRLGDVLIGRLGQLTHRLLLGLQRSPDLVDEAEAAWLIAARSTAFEVAELGLAAASPTSFLGRPGRNVKYPDRASDAEARFRATVNKILPRRESNDMKGQSL